MFTGFASENTPAIQVWDFFRTFASSVNNRPVSLADDCAPIQYFRTGGDTNTIRLYLPSAPIEGKQIKIINSRYGGNAQPVEIYVSDRNGGGTSAAIMTIGQGQTLDFCYSKNFISFGASAGLNATGWITLNQSPTSAANYNSLIACGNNNSAFSTNAFVAAGSSNQARGANSAIVGGSSNTASGASSAVVGGDSNSAGGMWAVALGGAGNSAGAVVSAVVGGQSNQATSTNGIIIGGANGTTRAIVGNFITPASDAPIVSSTGVQQLATLLLGRQTTNATATRLASDANAASTTNQVILPNNSAYYFRGECIAGVTGAGDTKGWYIEGVIKRGAGVGTTAIVGTASVTSLYADAGAATWAVTATADTTNGGLAITVTGAAATTIRWVCQIRTTEMTF